MPSEATGAAMCAVDPSKILQVAAGLMQLAKQLADSVGTVAEPRLYRLQEVAERLGQSDRTVRDAIEAGELRYTHQVSPSKAGRRISHAELVRFLHTKRLEVATPVAEVAA